jgi:sec-independent protein translocase protein TatA
MKEGSADGKSGDAAKPAQQVGGQTIDVEVKEKTKS